MKTKYKRLLLNVIFLSFLFFSLATAQTGIELAESLNFNVVKISTELSNGEDLNGFGMITGELGAFVYIITAAHVVEGTKLNQFPDKIEVEFYIDKRTFPAVIVNDDRDQDVAVLQVEKPDFFPFLKWKKNCLDLSPEKYTEARFIGLNGGWKIINQGIVNDVTLNRIIAQANVQPGTSGAPLLSDNGIVGMIIEDDIGNEATAVRISTLKEIITEDGRFTHMFQLTEHIVLDTEPDDTDLPINIAEAMDRVNSSSNQERLSGITLLREYALTNPNPSKGRSITTFLIDFIKTNLPDRKQVADGTTHDRGTYRASDISAALETLQEIRKANPTVETKLKGIDFDNVNLTELDLSGFDLSYCTFRHAFLSGANYIGTNFDHADFGESASWNSNFSNASFYGAKFYLAKFVNPVLGGTNIEKAADLRFALFRPTGLTQAQESIIAQYTTISK